MEVHTIPILTDNYSYLVIDKATRDACVVDPAEPKRVLEFVRSIEPPINLKYVLATHKHWDHSGGNEEMELEVPHIQVIGGAHDEIPGMNVRKVLDSDLIELGSLRIRVVYTPCHTKGHVCYLVCSPACSHCIVPSRAPYVASADVHRPEYVDGESMALFTGDTMFLAGCGRFFEGSAKDMHNNLSDIASLPHETRIYCGHEYSIKNLEFCATIEHDNEAIKRKLAWCKEQRAAGRPTVPSSLREELEYNVFLRSNVPTVAAAVGGSISNPVAVLEELRHRKDKF